MKIYPCVPACATRRMHKPKPIEHERMVMRSCAKVPSSAVATVSHVCSMLHVMPHTTAVLSAHPISRTGCRSPVFLKNPTAIVLFSRAAALSATVTSAPGNNCCYSPVETHTCNTACQLSSNTVGNCTSASGNNCCCSSPVGTHTCNTACQLTSTMSPRNPNTQQ